MGRFDADGSTTDFDSYLATLKERFLGADNRIKWGALFGGIGGSLFMYFSTLGVASVNSLQAAFETFEQQIESAWEVAIQSYSDTVTTQLAQTWDPFTEVGIFGLPFNAAAVLIAAAGVAMLAAYWRRVV